jgi:hypothetical protein
MVLNSILSAMTGENCSRFALHPETWTTGTLKQLKHSHGYHRRSLNEVVMFRYKTVFGSGLNARIMENQKTEVELKCSILNKFTGTGMPDSCKIN